MTSADGDDFVPTQEKLEWVTPKILTLELEDTAGKNSQPQENQYNPAFVGPS